MTRDRNTINNRLFVAVRKGYIEIVNELINLYGLAYSPAWSEGYVLLCEALKNQQVEVARILLTNNCKVINKKNKLTDTPLHYAALYCDVDIVEMILCKEVCIDAQNADGKTPLYNAISSMKVKVTEILLKYGADINVTPNNGESLLNVAADRGSLQIVEHLLAYGAYIDCVCTSSGYERGFTPLHFAVEKGHTEVVKLLLSKGASVDIKAKYGTALHVAAGCRDFYTAKKETEFDVAAGYSVLYRAHPLTIVEEFTSLQSSSKLNREEIVKLLLNGGSDVNAVTKNNYMPLYLATETRHEAVVKLLLQHGAKVDNQYKDGSTILYLAVKKGYFLIVEEVLKYCPDINSQSNRNCLKIAVCGDGEEYKAIVKALLEYGFNTNPEDVNDPDLLHAAVKKGYVEIVKDLLKYGADVNTFKKGSTPLHIAVKYKQDEVVKLLINYKADINALDMTLKAPISYATENADLKIMQLLLSSGSELASDLDVKGVQRRISIHLMTVVERGDLETVTKLIDSHGLSYSTLWSQGYSLLCEALKNKHTEVAKLLLTRGCKVNKNEFHTTTPLHYATLYNNIEIVEMLLNKGACINAQNGSGKTSLYNAIYNMKMEVIELLLKHGANVNVTPNNGESLLHFATYLENIQMVELLLKYGTYTNSICTFFQLAGMKDCTPLHCAVERGNTEVITLLLSKGAKINIKGENETLLHIAARNKDNQSDKDVEVVKLLLNRGCDVNATTNDNCTPLHIATKTGYEPIAKMLLKYGAKVDFQDKNNRTTLYFAVKEQHFVIVEDILRYCPDINNQSNRSCLKIAVSGHGDQNKKIVKALLEYGFTINPEDVNDHDLLYAAVEKGHLDIVKDLLKYGANVNKTFKEGLTPLHIASKYQQDEVVTLLMSFKADINAQDKTGKAPIFYAIENSDFKITKLLLMNEANIEDPELLINAVERKSIEIVEALLQHHVKINAHNKFGRTALHYTALKERDRAFINEDIDIKSEIAKLLLCKGANVDALTESGETPLYLAVCEGYAKVVEALLEYNANVNFTLNDGITLLHLSALRGNEEICIMLLNSGAHVNAVTRDGVTPLHVATQEGHKEVVKLLLKHGAKVDSKIKNDITSLHLAAQTDYQSIVEILLKFGAYIDCTDKHGRTALHIACDKKHVNIVITLLQYGADVNISCRQNITALYYATSRIEFLHIDFDSHNMIFHLNYTDTRFYFSSDNFSCFFNETVDTVACHIVKLKTANLYLSEQNFNFWSSISHYVWFKNKDIDFHEKCEAEISFMKNVKIGNSNVSFYGMLIKDTISLSMYLRNENAVQILKLNDYKKMFPLYASMIKNNFRKGMERKEILDQGHDIIHFLSNNCPELPYDCTEKIFSYLSNEELEILINVCKPQ